MQKSSPVTYRYKEIIKRPKKFHSLITPLTTFNTNQNLFSVAYNLI